jgi:mannosyltransferase
VIGLAPFVTRRYRRSREATLMWSLVLLPFATLLIAWLASQITPAFVSRYFAPALAAIFLLAAWGCSRAGVVGWVAILLSIVFVVHLSSYTPSHKSDVQDIGGEMRPLLHAGDLVIVAQPEQTPLAWYYLPDEPSPGLRWATTLGRVKDPTYMNWVFALRHLEHADPQATLAPLLASLRPGQDLLFIRPLTEGAKNWQASWTRLVRRRAAQWGALLQADPHLKPIAWAPHNYRSACCVADSAVLYRYT